MKTKLLALILVSIIALDPGAALADVKPYALCGEGMVLQQETDARL
jgi:hypothetical protein